MKRLLGVVVIAIIGLILYGLLTDNSKTAAPVTTSGPPVATARATPAPTVRPTPGAFHPPAPAVRSGQPSAHPAAEQARRAVIQASQRAQWRIIAYEPSGYNAARVTGIGDNARVQQFLNEVEKAVKLTDIQGPLDAQPVPDRAGFMRSTFYIRWQ